MEALDEQERYQQGVLSRELTLRLGEIAVSDDCVEPLTVLPLPYERPAA